MGAHETRSEQKQYAALGRAQASLMHEIRNALVTIGLLARSLRKSDRLRRKERDILDRLIETGSDGEHLLRDSLELFGKLSGKREPVKVAGLLQSVCRAVAPRAQARGVALTLAGTPDDRLYVECSRRKLRQALVNIARNGVDAMPKRAGVLLIGLRTAEKSFTIQISDAGEGMDEETRKRIFEPFFSTKKRGTGLGLALAKKTVEEHGGRITVVSEPKRGSTFSVRLPKAVRRCK